MIRAASVFTVAVLTALPTIATAQKTKSPTPTVKHDVLVEAQLRAYFGKVDANKDGFLDPAELAKAFRGPSAKPAPAPAYDDKGNFTAPTSTGGAKYPDQIYLLAIDKDLDDRISWDELDAYGEAYAAQLKSAQNANLQAMRTALAQAQRGLAARRNVGYSRNGSRYGQRRTGYSHSRNRHPVRRR